MLVMHPLLTEAGSVPRLIPTDSVTLVASGVVVDKGSPSPRACSWHARENA